MSHSEDLYKRAVDVLPAGVNSPVRAFRSVGGTPLFMASGEGPRMTDVDGQTYLDFCASWGPLILGHAHPAVKKAIDETVAKGWTFGTPTRQEVDLAEFVVDKLSAVEMIRFVNSGTEAVMSAIRLARGFTGRDRVLKFTGCYHGHMDYLLVNAGSGLATFGTASSEGVPEDFVRLTASLPLDDLDALSQAFTELGDELACVVIEGVPANNGLLVQDKAFIKRLRELCDQHGVLLIFDEVLVGWRMPEIMGYEHYGIKPDLVALGKVVGGGMPVGAYGGRKDIMERIAPLGGVYQAGTLSGNPVAMAAGLATLQAYYAEDVPGKIKHLGGFLDDGMRDLVADLQDFGYIRLGSLFWIYFYSQTPPKTAEAIHPDGAAVYAKLHRFMLDRGIYMAPSAFEVGFLNAAMTTDDLACFLVALQAAKKEHILT